jgi:3-methyladenine DNA glycosylase AlkD
MTFQAIIRRLKKLANAKNVAGMVRFGINSDKMLGISMPAIRSIGKEIGKDHKFALRLWRSGYHEARILASIVDDPLKVTSRQMDEWTSEFDSWGVCDQVCMNLFGDTKYAYQKAFKWSSSSKEFIKRAGYTMMAVLAVHDKKSSDDRFERFMPAIIRGSTDERNFVRKAVNWALRQIGKRNEKLKRVAIKTANVILKSDSKAARWIASDALRELRGR